MAVQMIFINVRSNYRLHIVTESFAEKRLCYLVGELGRDIIIGRETLYVVNGFHRAFALQRRRAVEMIFGELIINQPHLQGSGFSVGHTVYRGGMKQVFGLVGVEYVPQTFLDSSVESDMFTVRNKESTSFLKFS